MFENLLTDKLDIKFFKETNCYAFEIKNFLSDKQYNALRENLPDIKLNEFKNYNPSFDDQNSQHRLKTFVTEVNPESYNKLIYNNPILSEFVKTMKSSEFSNKVMKKFFFKILKSRIFDTKTLLKLLIRKNRSTKEKSFSLLDRLLLPPTLFTSGLKQAKNDDLLCAKKRHFCARLCLWQNFFIGT